MHTRAGSRTLQCAVPEFVRHHPSSNQMLKVASNPSLRKDVHRKVGVFSFFIFIFFINFALRIKRGGAVKNRNEKTP